MLEANGIRTVEHNGGLDSFLIGTPNRDLPDEAQTAPVADHPELAAALGL